MSTLQTATAPDRKVQTASILVVDDDPMVRAIAREMLAAEGYQVFEAVDGDQALKMIRDHPMDLVIMDMLMPNKDGVETIIELRKRQSPVRILAISSGGSMDVDSLLQLASAFGADAVMSKPLRLSTFASTVAALLAAPQTSSGPYRAV